MLQERTGIAPPAVSLGAVSLENHHPILPVRPDICFRDCLTYAAMAAGEQNYPHALAFSAKALEKACEDPASQALAARAIAANYDRIDDTCYAREVLHKAMSPRDDQEEKYPVSTVGWINYAYGIHANMARENPDDLSIRRELGWDLVLLGVYATRQLICEELDSPSRTFSEEKLQKPLQYILMAQRDIFRATMKRAEAEKKARSETGEESKTSLQTHSGLKPIDQYEIDLLGPLGLVDAFADGSLSRRLRTVREMRRLASFSGDPDIISTSNHLLTPKERHQAVVNTRRSARAVLAATVLPHSRRSFLETIYTGLEATL